MNPAASTPKPFIFASKKRFFAHLFGITAFTIGAAVAFPAGSLAKVDACLTSDRVFKNFQPDENKTTVPNTTFLAGDGSERTLADYRGKGIVLNFWATWCAPCVREMPQLDRLAALVRGNGVEVLTVSEDRKGMELAPAFYKKNNLNDLPVLIDIKSGLSRAIKAKGLPTTVLIDPDGKEVGRVLGVAEWDSPETVKFVRDCLSPKK
jgi:thiol-disulfide isomerase/thioredoxin